MTQLNLETAVPIGSLSADMTAVATSAVLQSGEGATMPDVPFVIGINEEAMVCTVVSTDTLTVTREFGDTTATTHSTDDEVSHVFTAEFFGLLPDDTDGSFYAQGDIDLDGNELIGHSETLAGLDDVDLTGIADGDHLAVTTGTYSLETTVPTPTAVPSSGTPANAIDGNTSTYWTALCSSGVMGINFDFGKSVTLSRIRIRYGVSYGAPFAIRKSTDGSTWIDVATYDNTHAVNSYVNHDFTETESRYWRLEERYGSGSYWRLYEVDFWSQQNTWYVESPAFVDNAGTFEAQGDIDLDGNDLLGGAFESDGAGGFDAQGDINMDGNALVGYSKSLAGLNDTDLTGIADGDSLVFSEGEYAALSRTAWTATASGYYNASTMPSNVIDGLPATLWHSAANSTGRWIQIDAGSAVSASRLVFTTDNYGGYNATLQRSDNGSSWTTVVASFAISSYTTHTEDFTEATARYWRVTTLGSGYFTCTEFDLWVADSVWAAASTALESDGSGGFDAQGDIDMNGNNLTGLHPSQPVTVAKVQRTSDYAIPSASTVTAIPWQASLIDTGSGIWESVTNPARLTAPVDGKYRITAGVRFEHDNNADVILGYWINGSAVDNSADHFGRLQDADTATATNLNGSTVLDLEADDYVEITAFVTTTTRNARADSFASMELLAPSAISTPMFDLLHSVKGTTDTPDDEFESTTLDSKWTAVEGSTGTVALDETGEVAKYDLASRPGWLLIQGGSASGQDVQLRQDFTIPDGSCIVAAMAWGASALSSGVGYTADEQQLGISVNDNDTSYISGNYTRLSIYTIADGARIVSFDGTTVLGATSTDTAETFFLSPGQTFFLRVDRDGLVYKFYFSADGMAWLPIGEKTFGTAPNNLWINGGAWAAGGEPVPVHAVKWIRQGTGGTIDPWNPSARVAFNPISTVARMVTSSDQSISATTETEVAWGATDLESQTGLISLSDNGFVAPINGYYRADVFLAWTSATPDECRIRGYIDDVLRTPGHWMARVDPNSTAYRGVSGNGTFYMEADEVLTFQVYFNEATTLRGATAGEECWATFTRVG